MKSYESANNNIWDRWDQDSSIASDIKQSFSTIRERKKGIKKIKKKGKSSAKSYKI